ncbi:fluoride efflux transporter CrcB [Conexibacter sp. JD483]|uniref:fluoride efflux transporter CrcB n=1 Tax=unclassified Conexibacter TaxID=2627773 RepID=UPI0027171DEF|nr:MULTISPECIES: fluoride efflux transporter CrcB [unclassified Conexibacter]MDO8189191.1 fluoride efflux transporter CrcB [Conexibacter sp. CPCC 205706]MDO8201924.1 fluoride efflux transporter CrcB [Conexibacter sp. CPCC 205762]MDR9371945.1 fluoride efflux transporter CrcB [Conexibacter sp. JD483]
MRPAPPILLAVFCGGAVGSLARAGVEEVLAPAPGHWPWGTLTVNLVAAFVLGALVARYAGHTHSERRMALYGPGFCGGLSTFSTLQLELFDLIDGGQVATAAGYAAASLAGGLALALLAMRLVERWRPPLEAAG